MVKSAFDPVFQKKFSKIKSNDVRERLIKLFEKIRDNPEIGKQMRYTRKGTREIYVSAFRLSYAYLKEENKIIFLDLYHKDEQ